MPYGSPASRSSLIVVTDEVADVEEKPADSLPGSTIGEQFLSAMPSRYRYDHLTDEQKKQFETEFKKATHIVDVIDVFARLMQTRFGAIRRIQLAKLDDDHYHSLWYCPECKHRMGRHDTSTGACPKGKFGLTEDDGDR